MNFYELMKEHGLTGYALAKKAGISQQVVNRIQSGQREFGRMQVESAVKIAHAMDMSVEEIIEKIKAQEVVR